MKKLNCIVCDNPTCRRVIGDTIFTEKGKKRILHFCSEKCRDRYWSKSKYN